MQCTLEHQPVLRGAVNSAAEWLLSALLPDTYCLFETPPATSSVITLAFQSILSHTRAVMAFAARPRQSCQTAGISLLHCVLSILALVTCLLHTVVVKSLETVQKVGKHQQACMHSAHRCSSQQLSLSCTTFSGSAKSTTAGQGRS